MKKTHIIWDWNGALLDDVNISLFAANQVFISLDIKPLTLNEYRQYYSVPIQKFYHNVLGRTPTKIEWKKIGNIFNYYYKPEVRKAKLCKDAIKALQYQQLKNLTQSVCSLMEQDDLDLSVCNTQVDKYFNLIHGRSSQLLKFGKSKQLASHIEKLNISPSDCVVIGDSTDDALSAFDAGAKSILYTGGTHSEEKLLATGAYVVNSLVEAAILAERIT